MRLRSQAAAASIQTIANVYLQHVNLSDYNVTLHHLHTNHTETIPLSIINYQKF